MENTTKFKVGDRVHVAADEDFVPGSGENLPGYDGPQGPVTGTVIEMGLGRGAASYAIVHVDSKFVIPYMHDRNLEVAVAPSGRSMFLKKL